MTEIDLNSMNILNPEDLPEIFGTIMEYSRDGLLITDHAGKILVMNRAYEEMFSVNGAEVLGCNVCDLVEKKMWRPNLFKRVAKMKQTVSLIQTTSANKNILSTGTPIFDEKKRIKYILFNDRDIFLLDHLMESLETREARETWLQFDLPDGEASPAETQGLVFRDPVMADLIQNVIRTARFNIPILLLGETGVGKSKVARLIHEFSDRRNNSFVELNCGAIPENLLESELFGHEKGAFTGAAHAKKGIFETADNGVLFLDEISEISLSLQVKLLKFLEKRELFRVGGVSPITIDARIIAASNRNLEQMVQNGEFRNDLFFRLNVVPIRIPPLRERKADIEPLIQFFLMRFNREFKTNKRMSRTTQKALCNYDFPGNVRELENLVGRLAVMTEENLIRIKHLPDMLQKMHADDIKTAPGEASTFKKAIAEFERKILLEAVKKHGSQNRAAKALGLNQSTLSRKLREH